MKNAKSNEMTCSLKMKFETFMVTNFKWNFQLGANLCDNMCWMRMWVIRF